MLHIPKIDDYLKILTDEEVKDFVAISFSEYFKSRRRSIKFVAGGKGEAESFCRGHEIF